MLVAGTAILTEQGEVPVEAVQPGDRVVTMDGKQRPVRWIGHRDTGNRAMFENADEALILHPDFAAGDGQRRREAGSCLPLVSDPGRAESLWRLLAERARHLGRTVPEPVTSRDPGLTLMADGRAVQPAIEGRRHCFALPPDARSVRLISRANAPCDVTPWWRIVVNSASCCMASRCA